MTIKFTCPHCTQRIEAPSDLIGTAVSCPTCNRTFDVGTNGDSVPLLPPRTVQIQAPKRSTKTMLKGCVLVCGGIVIVLILGVVALVALSSQSKQSHDDAIEQPMLSALEVVLRLGVEFKEGKHPSVALASAVGHLQAVDLSNCPPDFREAYIRFTHATSMWQSQADSLPKSAIDGRFQGIVNYAQGEADGGWARMMRAYEARQQEFKTALDELAAVGTRYAKAK